MILEVELEENRGMGGGSTVRSLSLDHCAEERDALSNDFHCPCTVSTSTDISHLQKQILQTSEFTQQGVKA